MVWTRSCHSRPTCSGDSSPSVRLAVCTASSKRFIATCRKIVAKDSSTWWHSIDSRTRGSRSSAITASNVSVSPNTEAVSARVSGGW